MFLRKHVGHVLHSMSLGDINSASRNNRVAIIAHSQLPGSLQVQSDPALDVLLPLIPLRLGLRLDSGGRQAGQLGPQPLECSLQCRKLRENKSCIRRKRGVFGMCTGIYADAKLACSRTGCQEGQVQSLLGSCLRFVGCAIGLGRFHGG